MVNALVDRPSGVTSDYFLINLYVGGSFILILNIGDLFESDSVINCGCSVGNKFLRLLLPSVFDSLPELSPRAESEACATGLEFVETRAVSMSLSWLYRFLLMAVFGAILNGEACWPLNEAIV